MRRNSVRLCNRAQSHLRALGVKVDLVPEGHFAQARAVQVKDRIREGGGRRGRGGAASVCVAARESGLLVASRRRLLLESFWECQESVREISEESSREC